MSVLLRLLRLYLLVLPIPIVIGMSHCSSHFLGRSVEGGRATNLAGFADAPPSLGGRHAWLQMRKQKASDRRTRRRQRGILSQEEIGLPLTVTESPMKAVGLWRGKTIQPISSPDRSSTTSSAASSTKKTGGRGRSKKRSTLYKSLSHYHNHFLSLLTLEYQAEVSLILYQPDALKNLALADDESCWQTNDRERQ
jgi:hypothetical protein